MRRQQQATMLALGGLVMAFMAIMAGGAQQLALGYPAIVLMIMALIVIRFQALY